MISAVLLLGAVTVERLAELSLARRNATALLLKGAHEVAPGHYPAIVLLHATWLACLWIFGWSHPLSSIWLAIFLVLQVFRIWILKTLGRRWTTRIIVLPGAPLVANGPYRFLSHPNFVVVVAEIAALPLCLRLPWLALIFSVACAGRSNLAADATVGVKPNSSDRVSQAEAHRLTKPAGRLFLVLHRYEHGSRCNSGTVAPL